MIAVMKEGIVVSDTHNSLLIKIAKKHYKKAPFVYITHRIHSYSVDPIIYIKTAKVSNLIGFAVVSKDPLQKSQTAFEKSFFKKEFRQFDDVASALLWKDTLIKNHQENIVLPNKKQKKRIK